MLYEQTPLNIENLDPVDSFAALAKGYYPAGENLRYCPGMHLKGTKGEAIDGTFGLQLLDEKVDPALAVVNMGFDINRDHILITQTPTALAPHEMNARQSRFVGFASKYRTCMPQILIELPKSLDLEYLLGYSLNTHPSINSKVRKGEISQDKAFKVLDQFYEDNGFFKGMDEMYYYLLS